MVRRLVALTTGVLLLRLNFVAVDLACAEHETPPTAAAASNLHEHGAHDSERPSSTTDTSDTCEAPVRADCCDAYVSCSIVLGNDVVAVDVLAPHGEAFLPLGIDRPHSRNDAPEPPPPKA